MHRRFLLLLAAWFASAAPGAPAGAGYRTLQRYSQVVETIGFRLAAAAGDLCPVKAPLTGIALHDLDQYPPSTRIAVDREFGFGGLPAVLAVADGSPAAAAGVMADDRIAAIDGQPIARDRRGGGASYGRVGAVTTAIEQAGAATVRLGLLRDGRPVAVAVVPVPGCASRFEVRPDAAVNAWADGAFVAASTAAVERARTPGELAAVVAHELAHNILRHRARLEAMGAGRGLFGKAGRSARLIRATEIEADRLAVHLLDRAGYPPDAMLSFLSHYRHGRGALLIGDATHPGDRERERIVAKEIAGIRAAPALGAQAVGGGTR